jgi:hypothetical protein
VNTNALLKTLSLAVIGLVSINTARASDLAPQPKIDACVAEVAARADLSDASVVRYDILSEQHRPRRHRLLIDATVYDGDQVLREYEAVCIVATEAEPVKFRLHETTAAR